MYRNLVLSTLVVFSVSYGWTLCGQAARRTRDARIAGCPQSPNCVSSGGPDEDHWIAPLAFSVSPDAAFHCVVEIIRQMKRTTIVVAEEGTIHAEFRTALGFVDDVTFQVDSGSNTILMRSASRMGCWDLGVNRRRLEAIRAVFDSKCR
jgi:uncharacterized protein (DUF1499 family)